MLRATRSPCRSWAATTMRAPRPQGPGSRTTSTRDRRRSPTAAALQALLLLAGSAAARIRSQTHRTCRSRRSGRRTGRRTTSAAAACPQARTAARSRSPFLFHARLAARGAARSAFQRPSHTEHLTQTRARRDGGTPRIATRKFFCVSRANLCSRAADGGTRCRGAPTHV